MHEFLLNRNKYVSKKSNRDEEEKGKAVPYSKRLTNEWRRNYFLNYHVATMVAFILARIISE